MQKIILNSDVEMPILDFGIFQGTKFNIRGVVL
jgi:hypothetical protein